MNKESIRIECMSEILDELGISASQEQIIQIVCDFSLHIEMENEQDYDQHLGVNLECGECKKLQSEINEFKKEINIYKNSVKHRRKTDDVWIENGNVMYNWYI